MIFSESDMFDLLMQGRTIQDFDRMSVDSSVKIESIQNLINDLPVFDHHAEPSMSVELWHKQQQSNWHMPEEYKNLDVAEHVLSLCETPEQLQRCGQELLLYQARDLFDLLRYLKYLVDIMTRNGIVWGVGRGSSVASYVLYKLGIHRIDSMYYDLDPREFLR